MRVARSLLPALLLATALACGPDAGDPCARQADGQIWIAELHRLTRLSGDGREVLGRGQPGPWSRPSRIAAAAGGGYWITQSGDALVRTDSALNVEWRSPPAALADPYDVVAQASGIWVSDRWGYRVVWLDLDGNVRCRGQGPVEPGDLVSGAGDRVWVRDGYDAGDSARDSLYLFEADCSLALAPIVLERVSAIAADGSGGVWIADTELDAVLHIDAQGAIVGDSRDAQLSFGNPECLAVDAAGNLWVGDSDRDSIAVLNPANLSLIADSGPESYYNAKRLVPATDGSVWVVDDWWERVDRLQLGGGVIEQLARVDYWAVRRATDVQPLAAGGALIVDNTLESITEVDAAGVVVGAYEGGDFGAVAAIALSPAQELWVADLERGQLTRHDREGALLQTFSHVNLPRPMRLAATSDGSVWAADASSGRLLLVAADGTVRVDASLSDSVHALSIDGDGASVWAAARYGNKIFLVDSSGELRATLDSPGDWYRPWAIHYDPGAEVIWLVDEPGQLFRLDRSGRLLGVTAGPFRRTLAAAAAGGVWVALSSGSASPLLRVDAAGVVTTRSGYYAAAYPDALFSGVDGDVFAARLFSDEVTWLDAEAREIRSWGGGLLHRPVAVAVAR